MKKYLVLIVALLVHGTVWARLDQEAQCLAQNVYHEARGEPWQGKVAVALVTINRTKHWRFPKTICAVVYQPGQFTWTTVPRQRITDTAAWQDSVLAATWALELGWQYAQRFPALYFHHKAVRPMWPHRKLAQIGNHIFYY